jgi:hypothetical protein
LERSNDTFMVGRRNGRVIFLLERSGGTFLLERSSGIIFQLEKSTGILLLQRICGTVSMLKRSNGTLLEQLTLPNTRSLKFLILVLIAKYATTYNKLLSFGEY